MHELGGSVVVITGASRGIGAAVAHAFADIGCHVVLAARSRDPLEELAREIRARYGVEVLAVPTDVTRTEQVDTLMQTAADALGGIDILINNAGLGSSNPLETAEDEEIRYLFDVNVMGPVRAMRAALPHLRRRGGGSIVNVGSVVSYMALPQYNLIGVSSTYCATKFALRAYATAVRAELHADNINVILAIVGVTRTDFFRSGYRSRQTGHSPERTRPLLDFLAVPPRKVAVRLVKAVQQAESEVYVSWWDYLAVRLAVLAPDAYSLMTRSLFGVLGRPPQAQPGHRPFWAGLHPRAYMPLAGVLLGCCWLWRRLSRTKSRSDGN